MVPAHIPVGKLASANSRHSFRTPQEKQASFALRMRAVFPALLPASGKNGQLPLPRQAAFSCQAVSPAGGNGPGVRIPSFYAGAGMLVPEHDDDDGRQADDGQAAPESGAGEMMTAVGNDLRALLARARRDPGRWEGRGLTLEELAARTGKSRVWLRQIEGGQAASASADTLGSICCALGIDAAAAEKLGYPDVAAAIRACVILSPAEHIRRTPGITARQKRLLLRAFRAIEKQPA